jgi:hypothetical protein
MKPPVLGILGKIDCPEKPSSQYAVKARIINTGNGISSFEKFECNPVTRSNARVTVDSSVPTK